MGLVFVDECRKERIETGNAVFGWSESDNLEATGLVPVEHSRQVDRRMTVEKLIIARGLLEASKLLIGAPRTAGASLFESAFQQVREQAKKFKEKTEKQAGEKLANMLIKDLEEKGFKVKLSLKLGKYKGSRFVTSAKLAVSPADQFFKAPDDERVQSLLNYLRGKYSPKYNLKDFQDGVAVFNVR